jgi:uncharacterized damage-inducible protein DinB
MADLGNELSAAFSDYLEKVAAKLYKWVEPLSDEQFWRNPFGYGNSIGHLVLHLTGNLNYYIGARIAGSGYVRDRDREFAEADCPSKKDALDRFDGAIALAVEAISKQSADDWTAPYSAERSTATNRLRIVLDCVAHADHHVGQIINLSREVMG